MTGEVLAGHSANTNDTSETRRTPVAAKRARRPWLQRPGMTKAIAPWVVGVVVLALWQGWCVLMRVPAYLVPSPSAIATELVQDAPLLFGSLLATLSGLW